MSDDNRPIQTLFGRPIVSADFSETLGPPGEIHLYDPTPRQGDVVTVYADGKVVAHGKVIDVRNDGKVCFELKSENL